jgi:hypothetical protein
VAPIDLMPLVFFFRSSAQLFEFDQVA